MRKKKFIPPSVYRGHGHDIKKIVKRRGYAFAEELRTVSEKLKVIVIKEGGGKPRGQWRRIISFGQFPNAARLSVDNEGNLWLNARTRFGVDDLIQFFGLGLSFCFSRLDRRSTEEERERMRILLRRHGVEPKF